MVKRQTVNVKWQVILTLLPITTFYFGGFYAAYRIEKLRKFVLLSILFFVAFLIWGELDCISEDEIDYVWPSNSIFYFLTPFDDFFGQSDISIKIIWIIEEAVWTGVMIFFMNKLSKEWNERLSASTPMWLS